MGVEGGDPIGADKVPGRNPPSAVRGNRAVEVRTLAAADSVPVPAAAARVREYRLV